MVNKELRCVIRILYQSVLKWNVYTLRCVLSLTLQHCMWHPRTLYGPSWPRCQRLVASVFCVELPNAGMWLVCVCCRGVYQTVPVYGASASVRRRFEEGTHYVEYKAVDESGNFHSCSFHVTVKGGCHCEYSLNVKAMHNECTYCEWKTIIVILCSLGPKNASLSALHIYQAVKLPVENIFPDTLHDCYG